MLWRKFKLDWRYAIGELFIVVAGVLVALAIDQWNDQRLERQEADEILQHLLFDLQVDLNGIQIMVRNVKDKEQNLLRLKSIFDSDQRPVEGAQFLHDIGVGADFGWNQNRPVATTYQEALSSGKFGLICNAELRSTISVIISSLRTCLTAPMPVKRNFRICRTNWFRETVSLPKGWFC